MEYDVIIVGGGYAGMQSALELKKKGIDNILLLEMEDSLGGALRDIIETDPSFGNEGETGVEISSDLASKLYEEKIPYRINTRVIDVMKNLTLETLNPSEGVMTFKARAIIFATGSREKPRGILNFTSKRLTGIFSVGTARQFIVEEGYLPGKRVVIYGSDYTGLYLAKILKVEGAHSVTIVGQYRELEFPNEGLKAALDELGIEYVLGYSISEIDGDERIEGITFLDSQGIERYIPCDCLLLSVGLSPSRSLFKKFRREPESSGVFVVGNADGINFNVGDIKKEIIDTVGRTVSYLNKP